MHGASAAQLFEFGPDGAFIREIGQNLYGFAFAHTVRIDKDDNIWATDEGTNMVIKFSPAGKVLMVLGRRAEAVEAPAPEPAPGTQPRPGWGGVQPSDRRRLGSGRQRLHRRRLQQLARREGRSATELGEDVGHARQGAGAVQHPAHDRQRREGQHLCRRPHEPPHPGVRPATGTSSKQFTIDVPFTKEPNVMLGAAPGGGGNPLAVSGAPWAICITPAGATQFLYVSDAVPGRIYKLTLDGKVLGVLGEAGKEPKQFGWIHEIACPSENELYVAELLNWRVQKLSLRP